MKRIPDNKTNLVLAAILVALGVAAALTVGSSSSSGAAVTRTAAAQRGVVLSSVSATGNVEASQSLNVNFITGGQVTAVDVKPGQKVTEGEVLGKIDSQSAQLAVEPGPGSGDLGERAARQREPAGADLVRAGAARAEGGEGGRLECQGRCTRPPRPTSG